MLKVRRNRLSLTRAVAFLVILAVTTLALAFTPAQSARANSTGSNFYAPGSSNEKMVYDRVIRLQNSGSANGTLLGTFEHANLDGTATTLIIRKSTDDGTTWSTLSTVSDPLTGTGHPSSQLWQPFLYEFPTTLGAYPAGTLLLVANSAPAGLSSNLVEWRSTNQGATWTYVSLLQSGGTDGSGVWEPFLTRDSSGNLNMYFADERNNTTYAQKIAHIVSTDGGATWSANPDGSTRVAPGEVSDVASSVQADHPGMPTIAKTGSGLYVMSFEACGPTYGCQDAIKTSTDGDTWSGGVTSMGTVPSTGDGRLVYASPYVVWSPAGGSNGELLLTGRSNYTGEDGQIILVNTNNGTGTWSWLPAPLKANDVASSNCTGNYSPNLLLSTSGQSVRYTAASVTNASTGACDEVTAQANAGVLPFSSDFSGGDSGWLDYGGCWTTSAGVYSETCGGNGGNKAIAGSTGWTNYTAQADVRIDSGTQAGLIVRVSNPSVGTDSLNGYYVGIDTGGNLNLGRESNGWTALHSATITGGVALNSWFHLAVQASGCTFTVSAVPVGSTAIPTAFTYTDTVCTFSSGAVGVRDQGSTASFRNITATAGATTTTSTPTYNAPFASGTATGWTTYGGTWATSAANESYANTTGGSGDKSISGSPAWGNYSVTGDVELNTTTGSNPNAGLIVRVTNPAVGADSFNGYYAGVTSSSLILGRESYGWTALASTALPTALTANTWYHLSVEVVGCVITVTGVPSAGGAQVSASYNDAGCTSTTGAIGVRTYNSTATWRDITVTPR